MVGGQQARKIKGLFESPVLQLGPRLQGWDREHGKGVHWDLVLNLLSRRDLPSGWWSPASALLRRSPLNRVELGSLCRTYCQQRPHCSGCFCGLSEERVNWIISSVLPHKGSAGVSHQEQVGNLSNVSSLAAVLVQHCGEHILSPGKSTCRVYYRKKHICLILWGTCA